MWQSNHIERVDHARAYLPSSEFHASRSKGDIGIDGALKQLCLWKLEEHPHALTQRCPVYLPGIHVYAIDDHGAGGRTEQAIEMLNQC